MLRALRGGPMVAREITGGFWRRCWNAIHLLPRIFYLCPGPVLDQPCFAMIDERIARDRIQREPQWTQCVAVGSEAFVRGMESRIRGRQEPEVVGAGFHQLFPGPPRPAGPRADSLEQDRSAE